jgi:hypothetical protein
MEIVPPSASVLQKRKHASCKAINRMKVATCNATIALFSKIGASVGNSKTWKTLPHQCISHWLEQINSSQLSTLASRYALNTNHQTILLKPIQEQHAIGWKQGVLCYLSISWATARLLEYPRTTIAGAQNWVKTFMSALRTLNAKMWDTHNNCCHCHPPCFCCRCKDNQALLNPVYIAASNQSSSLHHKIPVCTNRPET